MFALNDGIPNNLKHGSIRARRYKTAFFFNAYDELLNHSDR